MSDNHSDRPDDAAAAARETPSVPAADHVPSGGDAAPVQSTSADAAGAGSATPQDAAPPAAGAPAVPAYAAPAAAPGAPPAWTGTTPAYPRPPYGAHAGYGGQAAPQRSVYAAAPGGHAAPGGQAFGIPAPQHTQPTQAIPGADNDIPRKRSGAGKVVGLIVAAALVGGAAGLGGAYAGVSMWGESETAPVAGPSTITVNDTDDVNATTAIAAKVVPSVVTISARSGSGGGTGSGVIMSEDGYVVTNTHVVTLDGQTADATIRATTSDGRVFDAEVVGTDPIYDLAVIKLNDASGLTPIEFADSSDLNVGDETVAVGAPLGLSNTVTTGIVSALNRSIEVASSAAPDEEAQPEEGQGGEGGQDSPFFFDFGQGQRPGGATETIKIAVIQTDAAINPGNSGGALVDSEGRLIGINVAIASAGGSSGQAGSIGVGFAIPSVVAQRVADEIIQDGSASHGLLGATVQPMSTVENADIAGAYIASVTDGGAAAQAGLRSGDVVTAFNGVPIVGSVDLTAQVRALAAGSTTTITFVRGSESQTVDVTLGTLES